VNFDLSTIAGVVLAGGKGSRMNYADKPLLEVGGRTIIESILDTASSQVGSLIINVNCHPERYARFNLPLVKDDSGDFAGPLAGIHATLNYAVTNLPEIEVIACFPGDTPWFPGDIVENMLKEMYATGNEVVWLRTDGQVQPLFSVWSVTLCLALGDALMKGMYSPMQFILGRRHSAVDYPGFLPGLFSNINTPEDLENARSLATKRDVLAR
jgi:molybdopterin-guanine dinucleotide biosynthesis protein A